MDSQDLFQHSKKIDKKITGEARLIGLIDSIPFSPLVYGFGLNSFKHELKVSYSNLKGNAHKLREGEIEIALISSLDYALKKESWQIVPDLCLTSPEKIKHVQLFFKKGLKDIRTIAIDEEATSESILLKILMREKYMLSPDYISMSANIDEMFSKAEAVLIVGEKALEYYQTYRSRLDLNEEWLDMTGLPFVYAFWAGRELTITSDDLKAIRFSYELGEKNLEKISKEFASKHEENWVYYHDYLTKNLSFTFSDREKEGLNEFYNYAFFYGYTEFIPDLQFYKI